MSKQLITPFTGGTIRKSSEDEELTVGNSFGPTNRTSVVTKTKRKENYEPYPNLLLEM